MPKKNPFPLLDEFVAAARKYKWPNNDIAVILRDAAEKIDGKRWLSFGPADSALVVRGDGLVELFHKDFESGEMPTQDQFMLISLEDNFRDERLLALIETFQAEARASDGFRLMMQ